MFEEMKLMRMNLFSTQIRVSESVFWILATIELNEFDIRSYCQQFIKHTP